MPLPAFVVVLTVTCTKPLTSKAKEDVGLKSPFTIVPYMPGARTITKCAIGAVRRATTLKSAIRLATANTAYDTAMTALTVSILTIFVMSSRTVKSTLLTPTLSAATVLPLTMTLTSKGR